MQNKFTMKSLDRSLHV